MRDRAEFAHDRFIRAKPERRHRGAAGAIAMVEQATHTGSNPLRVCLVALPDAVLSTLAGIYDVMNLSLIHI